MCFEYIPFGYLELIYTFFDASHVWVFKDIFVSNIIQVYTVEPD